MPRPGTVAITCDSQGCQPVLHDPSRPNLSQSLAWHHLCLWVVFLINQEKRGSNPGLFWKVGFAAETGQAQKERSRTCPLLPKPHPAAQPGHPVLCRSEVANGPEDIFFPSEAFLL